MICRLNECIVTEITVSNERCFLTCFYKSPNQNQEQIESFCKNLIDVPSGINNQQPICSIVVGDINAKLSKCWQSNKDNKAGQDTYTFTTTSGYTQMIGQPTNILNDKSSCINLLFTTNNSKMLCNVGVKQIFYNKCHHNILYDSVNPNILPPPLYYKEVWDCKSTDPVCIQWEIWFVDWNNIFSNKKTDGKVKSLNNISLNICRNVIPNKVIKVGYKYPKWMNPKFISSLRNRAKMTKRYYPNPTKENKDLLTAKSNKCSNMIVETKERYTNELSKKLDDPSTMPKAHWSILKCILE